MHVGSDLLKLNGIKFRRCCYFFVYSSYFSNFRLKRIEDFSLYQITSRLNCLVVNRVEILFWWTYALFSTKQHFPGRNISIYKLVMKWKAQMCHEDHIVPDFTALWTTKPTCKNEMKWKCDIQEQWESPFLLFSKTRVERKDFTQCKLGYNFIFPS